MIKSESGMSASDSLRQKWWTPSSHTLGAEVSRIRAWRGRPQAARKIRPSRRLADRLAVDVFEDFVWLISREREKERDRVIA